MPDTTLAVLLGSVPLFTDSMERNMWKMLLPGVKFLRIGTTFDRSVLLRPMRYLRQLRHVFVKKKTGITKNETHLFFSQPIEGTKLLVSLLSIPSSPSSSNNHHACGTLNSLTPPSCPVVHILGLPNGSNTSVSIGPDLGSQVVVRVPLPKSHSLMVVSLLAVKRRRGSMASVTTEVTHPRCESSEPCGSPVIASHCTTDASWPPE